MLRRPDDGVGGEFKSGGETDVAILFMIGKRILEGMRTN